MWDGRPSHLVSSSPLRTGGEPDIAVYGSNWTIILAGGGSENRQQGAHALGQSAEPRARSTDAKTGITADHPWTAWTGLPGPDNVVALHEFRLPHHRGPRLHADPPPRGAVSSILVRCG